MLAYVFWHVAEDGSGTAEYEATLLRFGDALTNARIPGMLGCASYAIGATPWTDEPGYLAEPGHEDWVFVEDSSALDTVNERAVSGSVKEPHDAIARITKHRGFGALYYLVDGEHSVPSDSTAFWLSRPRGVDWRQIMPIITASASSDVTVWRRQMVLGPAPEFALIGPPALTLDVPPEWNATAVERRRLVTQD